MKKLSAAGLIIIASFALSACGEKNPLLKQDTKKVAAFLFENSGPAVGHCGKVWANPKAANETVIANCEEQAFYVAEQLTKQGYGEISSANIKIPELWQEFNRIGAEKLSKQKPFTFDGVFKKNQQRDEYRKEQ